MRGSRGLGGGGLLLLILIVVGVLYILPRVRAGGGGGEQPDEQQTFPTVPTPPGGTNRVPPDTRQHGCNPTRPRVAPPGSRN